MLLLAGQLDDDASSSGTEASLGQLIVSISSCLICLTPPPPRQPCGDGELYHAQDGRWCSLVTASGKWPAARKRIGLSDARQDLHNDDTKKGSCSCGLMATPLRRAILPPPYSLFLFSLFLVLILLFPFPSSSCDPHLTLQTPTAGAAYRRPRPTPTKLDEGNTHAVFLLHRLTLCCCDLCHTGIGRLACVFLVLLHCLKACFLFPFFKCFVFLPFTTSTPRSQR